MRRLPVLLLPCLLAMPAAAQGPIDFTRLRPARDSFVVMLQGKPAGYEVITLDKTDTGFLVVDHTNLMPRMQQVTEIVIGANGEMGIGAAAQLHVACSCEHLSEIPHGIIGHHFYEEDISLAVPLEIDGVLARLPDGPGLGVEPSDEVRRSFT